MHTNGSQSHCAQATSINKLIYLCTEALGGLYHGDGRVLQPGGGDRASATNNRQCVSLMERTHIRLRFRETARQQNLESVLARVAKLSDGSYREATVLDTDKVDIDWANLFFSCALELSNKTMQILLAKALVAELSHPGSISKRSLLFLLNCDSWEVKAFRKIVDCAFLGENGHPFVFRSSCDSRKEDPLLPAAKLLPVCSAAGLLAVEPSPLASGFSFNHNGRQQIVRARCSETHYIHRFTKIGSDIYSLLSRSKTMSQTGAMLTVSAKSRALTCQRLVWNHLNSCFIIDNAAA